jgi:UDP-N-acetylmuramate--alanine ligase
VRGVGRRIEVKGEAKGITVVDDYGHHPTEIKTTLAAVAQSWPGLRKVVVFQPHRYTRTQSLFDEFTRAFYQSDRLLVLPIYAASETPIEGVESRKLSDQIRAHGHKDVRYMANFDVCQAFLMENLEAGDLLLTLGAGDVVRVGEKVLAQLQRDEQTS